MSDEKKTINIGEMLTAARDGKGLSIPTAALHCNLEASIIEKLEANKFSEIGAPVFTRGYLNLYARCLGLNEHEVSEAFNQLKSNPTPSLQISEANAASQSKSFKHRSMSKWVYLVPLFIVLGLALQQLLSNDSWLINQLNKALVSPSQEGNQGEKSVLLTVGNEHTPTSENSATSDDNTTSTAAPVEDTSSANTDDATATANTASPEAGTVSPNNSEITLTSTENTEGESATVSEEQPVETATTPEPAVNESEAIKLNFGGGESWVQIDNASKKIVRSGLVKKGETITLPASGAPYSFNIGRPENVEMTIYGKAEKLEKYQRSGSARRFNVSIPNG